MLNLLSSLARRASHATLLAAAATLWASAASAEDRALIIGIDNYNDAEEGAPSKLDGPVRDAKMMQEVATKIWGFKSNQVRTLFDDQATAANILGSMEDWLIAGTKPGDRVFLFFSGHGTSFAPPPDYPEQNLRIQALVAYNPPNAKGEFFVYDKFIRDRLAKMPDREIIVIVDSCFSGTITRSSRSEPRKYGPEVKLYEPTPEWLPRGAAPARTMRGLERNEPGPLRENPNVISFTAVTSSQLSQIDVSQPAGQRYSVFARRLYEGIALKKADRTGSGKVTVTQLFDFARDETAAYCDTHAKQCNEHSAAPGMTPELETPDKWRGLDLMKWGGGAGGGTPSPQQPDNTEPSEVIGSGNVPAPQVAISAENGIVKLGEQIKVGIKSKFAGYAIVLDVREDGKIAQLFPSKACRRPNRSIRPDAALIMPDPTYGCAFAATEPGKGRIVVIVSEDDIPVEQLLNQSKDTIAVKDGARFMAQLSKALNSTWRKDVSNRPVRWSMAEVKYDVRK